MVPPTLFVSGAVAVMHVVKNIYERLQAVKRCAATATSPHPGQAAAPRPTVAVRPLACRQFIHTCQGQATNWSQQVFPAGYHWHVSVASSAAGIKACKDMMLPMLAAA